MGVTQIFSITFPYIEFSDVRVSVGGVLQVLTTDYIFANATQVSFVSAPPVGAEVLLQRVTSSDDIKFTFFPGSAIRARDLNDNFTQTLYVIQEADISADDATDAAREAIDAANEAKADAAAAVLAAEQAQSDAAEAKADAAEANAGVSASLEAANESAANALTAQEAATQAAIDAAAAQQAAQDAADAVAEGPVVSVNGKQGLVVLTTNDLVNDSGYITIDDIPEPPDNALNISALPTLP